MSIQDHVQYYGLENELKQAKTQKEFMETLSHASELYYAGDINVKTYNSFLVALSKILLHKIK